MRLLEVDKLNKYFGGLAAVSDVSFHIDRGEIMGLIGPNGAGKTTTFNLISGSFAPTSGTIKFKGQNIVGMKPYLICRMGMARTFQSIKLFPHMSVKENVLLGSLFGARLNMPQAQKEARELLEFVGLEPKSELAAMSLSIGDQKRLEVARALATKPELLLLDEVMAGLNPTEVEAAIDLIKKINARGITILIIEHVMRAIMDVSSRVLVLHYGAKLCEGTPEAVCADPQVIQVYLGESITDAKSK
jgi:branched-chain amino acid transport system ATP-binding protein